ncbi:G-type lectin S-receptor-like serine/threonine-protein kinase At1g67520 [Ipomoea triloba]|uniref:G-type lectin S-receptor-like serine/threonine-protein kinase At1g67520 n=1 Tax=Ipomoea triloba TaxID=35885 RepID=UPI00125D2F04|nr:G-type lectin S-receptor-like serine/threonine-protein kinase At1g67520 [Ipomoea triloba]XP_031124014.1 G-type lectin S-receptor-like serine/threonine-protein kinase At1g67520 [Ipomoea triloba]
MEWMNDNVAMERVFFLLILCSLSSIASSQSDTLKQGDVLKASDESNLLVSASNTYSLGFFMPERTKRTYLAIRLAYSDWDKPVWIGNRDAPLPTISSASLHIDAYGRLILAHNEEQDNSYLLSSKQTSLNVTATLLNSGKLVLREVNTDGSFGEELWSSFDNPTDTLLPGMKLGVDHRTGRNWALRSWQDDDIPWTGAYSLEWEPSKRRLVIKYGGVVRWTSGELMTASNFQHIRASQNYKFVNISTKEEEHFSYLFTFNPYLPQPDFLLQGWRLDALGILSITSDGGSIMDVGECYGYENETQQSKGCELWEQPKCRGDGQTFEERYGRFVFHTENEALQIQATPISNCSDSPSDCREYCWNDCHCVGYRSNNEGVCECWMGTSSLQFEEDTTGNAVESVYVLNRPAEGKSRIKKWICRILIPTAISLLLLGFLLLWWRRRKQEEARKEQELKDLFTLDDYTDIHELNNGENVSIKVFTYEWIVATTNNFSLNCKLGQGGFGTVYKGVTPEGQEVAIKQLSERSKQGIVEFKNEVILIAKLQHTNLVKLLGFCIHKDQKMLIYEFMLNKSLDFYLFDQNPIGYLSWKRRINIIEGIAQGLLYLHMYSRVRIIHRDMKVSNILLDENMNPKISDFGIAKILKQNATEANTMRLVGTFGYMAPEYVLHGVFSMKSDVYSFGVLVLEIVSGKKNNGFHCEDGPLNLVEHAWELWNKDAVLQLVDPSLISNLCGNEEQLRRCINVGLLCVEDSAVDRPSMADVVSMFTNENLALPKPKKPAFVSRFGVSDTFQDGQSRKFTVNELSISTMEAR